MSDPNLPEGVKQSDIDALVGETFDPDLCEHENIACENCDTSFSGIECKLAKAREDNVRLRGLIASKDEALRMYGKHFSNCEDKMSGMYGKYCACGLIQALTDSRR